MQTESAFDPEHPYYDEKSSRENPKWHLVHVAFRQKFPEIIRLKDLQKFSKERGELENMQTLKRSRLSVSKVSKKEWDFIVSLVDVEDVPAAAAATALARYRLPMGTNGTEADVEPRAKSVEVEEANGKPADTALEKAAPANNLASIHYEDMAVLEPQLRCR